MVIQETPVSEGDWRHGFKNIPWGRKWKPTSVFLPGESHEQMSLVDYST